MKGNVRVVFMTTQLQRTPPLLLRNVREIKQVFGFLDRFNLDELRLKYQVDFYVKEFHTKDLLKIGILFFYSKEAHLKHFLEALHANEHCCRLFGLPHTSVQHVYKALKKRCWWFFYEAFHQVSATLKERSPSAARLFHGREIKALDSTFLEYAIERLFYARFGYSSSDHQYKEGIKLHVLYSYSHDLPEKILETPANVHDSKIADALVNTLTDCILLIDKGYHQLARYKMLHEHRVTFVIPCKKNMTYVTITTQNLPFETGDVIIKKVKLSNDLEVQHISVAGFELLCNDLSLQWYEIAGLYSFRWEIENLFKKLKQHWRINKPLFRNHNSIMAFICITMIAMIILEKICEQEQWEFTPTLHTIGREIEAHLLVEA
jgi:hypothetical protein